MLSLFHEYFQLMFFLPHTHSPTARGLFNLTFTTAFCLGICPRQARDTIRSTSNVHGPHGACSPQWHLCHVSLTEPVCLCFPHPTTVGMAAREQRMWPQSQARSNHKQAIRIYCNPGLYRARYGPGLASSLWSASYTVMAYF